MNADGSGQSSLTQNEGWNGDPAWSADGAQIAYVSVTSLRGGTSDVYVMEADGRRKTNLTQDQTSNWAPSWSRDGTKIAYEAAPVRYNEVFVMDPDGNNQTNLTRHDASDRVPSWSPDGLLIAFASNRDREPGTYDIYTMASDGSNVQRLTHGLLWDVTSGISWSPDGSRIAYASWTVPGTGTAISVMGSDGENHVRLTQARFATNTPGRHFDYWSPQWSPDGTRIAFTSNRDAVFVFDKVNGMTVAQSMDIYVMDVSAEVGVEGLGRGLTQWAALRQPTIR